MYPDLEDMAEQNRASNSTSYYFRATSVPNSKVIFIKLFPLFCWYIAVGLRAILGGLALRVMTEVKPEIDFT